MAALVAGASAYGVHQLLPDTHRFIIAGIVLPAYGLIYLAGTLAFRIPEAAGLLGRLRRRGPGPATH